MYIFLLLSSERLSPRRREFWEPHQQALLGAPQVKRHQVELREVPGRGRRPARDAVVPQGQRLGRPSRHLEIPRSRRTAAALPDHKTSILKKNTQVAN